MLYCCAGKNETYAHSNNLWEGRIIQLWQHKLNGRDKCRIMVSYYTGGKNTCTKYQLM